MIISSGFPPFSPALILPERPLEPPEDPVVHCPVCGAECDKFYRYFRYGDVLGCENCVYETDAENEEEEYL